MTKPLLIVTAVLSGGAAGFGLGYVVAYKRLEMDFERRLEKETAGMREFYQVVKKPFATPQEAAAALIVEGEAIEPEEESTAETANNKVAYHKIVKKEYQSDGATEEVLVDIPENPDVELKHHNVFSETPVIISQEEFMENDSGYIQGQLTYYKLDKILTDERESTIDDKAATVGLNNLEMFGDSKSLSSDPNVIHVRNPRLQMEFEICLSENSYSREVLGMEEDPPQLPSGRKRS